MSRHRQRAEIAKFEKQFLKLLREFEEGIRGSSFSPATALGIESSMREEFEKLILVVREAASYQGPVPRPEVETLRDRVSALEAGRVEMIAKHGDEKRQLQEAINSLREEWRQHLLAGMLLVRETIKTSLRQDKTVRGFVLSHVNLGIEELVPFVEAGLMHMSPEGLELYCESVLRRLDAQSKDKNGG